jgi:hypothetical protein
LLESFRDRDIKKERFSKKSKFLCVPKEEEEEEEEIPKSWTMMMKMRI